MGDTQDKHLHYNDKGEPIYLSGLKTKWSEVQNKISIHDGAIP